MGITIRSNKRNADLGYGGFNQFRTKVANLAGLEFGKHYEALNEATLLLGIGERESFIKEYNDKTIELINLGLITARIANFCYQSDCEGSIDQEQAKEIYEKIKDFDDNVGYGYIGRPDCAMFSDLKEIIKDCAENGGTIEWY